jgi:Leucine Rich repeat
LRSDFSRHTKGLRMSAVNGKSRFSRLASPKLFIVFLLIEGGLWTSARFGWFGLNRSRASFVQIALVTLAVLLTILITLAFQALVFRHRIKFSVASLPLLTLTLAIPCSWLGNDVARAIRQREVVNQIRIAGGRVVYDYEPAIDVGDRADPPGPEWLRSVLGDDLFVSVTTVDLTNARITDMNLGDLKRLPELTALKLYKSALGDREVEQIGELIQLESLNIALTKVGDAEFKRFARLKQLRALRLDGTAVGDDAVNFISDLSHLESLYLDFTRVTDAGVEPLAKLHTLRTLSLRGTDVTDAGAQKLGQALPNCWIRYDGGEIRAQSDKRTAGRIGD